MEEEAGEDKAGGNPNSDSETGSNVGFGMMPQKKSGAINANGNKASFFGQ